MLCDNIMKKGKPFPETISLSYKIETGETINFYGIYDPDDNSPEIRNLIEGQKFGWKKELVEAVAQYVMDKMKEIDKKEYEPYPDNEDYFSLKYECLGREDNEGNFIMKIKKRVKGE